MTKNTAISTELSKLPAHLATFSEEAVAGLQTETYPVPNKISTQGKTYTLIKSDGTQIDGGSTIRAVVLNANPYTTKTMFSGTYSADEKVAPVCSSRNGKTPDAHILANPKLDPQPQNCLTCPYNILGSGKDGKGKACSDTKMVAVLPELDNEPALLTLKVTGLIQFKNYLKDLQTKNKVKNPSSIITELGFQLKDAKTNAVLQYPRVSFKPVAYIPENLVERVIELQNSPEVLQMLHLDEPEMESETYELPAAKESSWAAPAVAPALTVAPEIQEPSLDLEDEVAIATKAIDKALADDEAPFAL